MTVCKQVRKTRLSFLVFWLIFGLLVSVFELVNNAPMAQAQPSTPNPDFWVTNGAVRAIVPAPDGTTYLGGNFSNVGPLTGYAVPVNGTTGAAANSFPKVNGQVNAIIPDGSGGWFLGGEFTKVGSVNGMYLAHVLSDGTVETGWPEPNVNVRSLALSGTTLYVGGFFTSIGGFDRNRVAAVSTISKAVLPWDPNVDNTVETIVVDEANSLVYIGGSFTFVNTGPPVLRRGLAAISMSTGAVTGWDPGTFGSSISALALSNDGATLYAGGSFSTMGANALSRTNLVAIETSGAGNATAWNADTNGIVNTLILSGTTLYAGGEFTTIDALIRNRIAALNTADNNNPVTAWDPNADQRVNTLALSGTTLYIGGQFTAVNGATARSRVAAVSTVTGTVDGTWIPEASNEVLAIALDGDTIYLGGRFASMGVVGRNGLAQIDVDGTATDWNPDVELGLDDTVSALALDGSGATLYVGGLFDTIGGELRNNIAAVSTATGIIDPDWDPNANGAVRAILVNGTKIYFGGDFTTVNALVRNRIAAVDDDTGALFVWNPNSNNTVRALAQDDTAIYAGGDFTSIGAASRDYVARLDKTTGVSTPWVPNPNGAVYSLAFDAPFLYLGGAFTEVTGLARNHLAQVNTSGDLQFSWNPNVNDIVYAMALSDKYLYIAGAFTTIGAVNKIHLAEIDLASAEVSSWGPNTSLSVFALAASENILYAGGEFYSVVNEPQPYFVVFGPPTLGFTATSSSGIEAATPAYLSVLLSDISGFDVQVDYAVTGGTATGGGVDYTLANGTLTISAGETFANFSIGIVDDGLAESNETIQITLSNVIGAVLGANAVNTYTIFNNDVGGVTITESGGSTDVAEQGTTDDTYTVVLNTEPTANVEISRGPDSPQVFILPPVIPPLIFTPANWNVPQTITVTAVDDAILEGPHTYTLTHSAGSPDANYNTPPGPLTIDDVVVNITDNDQPGVTFTPPGPTDVTEGGATDTFDTVLDSPPTANVVITFTNDAQVDVNPNQLTFTTANWDTPQTVTVSAVDDAVFEGDHTGGFSVDVSSADLSYDGLLIGDQQVNITDNDLVMPPSFLATDLLGQLDIDDNPIYTQAVANNGSIDVNDRGFNFPVFVELDSVGHRLFVSDMGNNRVLVFNLNASNQLLDRVADAVLGQPGFITGDLGLTDSTFNQPFGLEFDADSERLFVADAQNNRVLVFDVAVIGNGEPAIKVLGQPDFETNAAGTTATGMTFPVDMLLDGTRLFVAVPDNNRVLIFDVATIENGEPAVNVLGQPDLTMVTADTTDSKMNGPASLALDTSTDRLFVSEVDNSRVLIFDVATVVNGEPAINVLGQPDFISSAAATSQTGLSHPIGIDLDETRDILYVADANTDDPAPDPINNRIMVFDVTTVVNDEPAVNVLGQPTYIDDAADTTQNRFHQPFWIMTDEENNRLYVTDSKNNRVMIFDLVRITTAALPNGTRGTAYNQALAVISDQGAVTYAIQSGALPTGLALDPDTGEISGTPTTTGTSNFTIRATDTIDVGGFVDDQALSITIASGGGGGGGGLGIVLPTLPAGVFTHAQANELLPLAFPVDSLVKLPDDGNPNTYGDTTVYYLGLDAKRHPFLNEKIYFSWYADFSAVRTIDSPTLASISLGKPILIRPGTAWAKIQTDPKTYYVEPGSYVLREIVDESVARLLGGDNWNQNVMDIDPAFFVRFEVGDPITLASLGSDWPTAALLKTPTDSTVWYITPTTRRPFTTFTAFIDNYF